MPLNLLNSQTFTISDSWSVAFPWMAYIFRIKYVLITFSEIRMTYQILWRIANAWQNPKVAREACVFRAVVYILQEIGFTALYRTWKHLPSRSQTFITMCKNNKGLAFLVASKTQWKGWINLIKILYNLIKTVVIREIWCSIKC